MSDPKSPGGQWRRNRDWSLTLVIDGAPVARVARADPGAYVWALLDDGAQTTARSEYAAQRAVRRALREREGVRDAD